MTSTRPLAVVVLAAGDGTRMRSATPKVLHSIGGRSLLSLALTSARGVAPEQLVVVVRAGDQAVAEHVGQVDPGARLVEQHGGHGTGRAVECALEALPADGAGTVLVTMGDVPLLAAATLGGLLDVHLAGAALATVVTVTPPDPTGYGRILRDPEGRVRGSVEQADATPDQLRIREVNTGIYAFDVAALRSALGRVGTDNAQGEKYLTDVLAVISRDGGTISSHAVADRWETEGVNDRVQLALVGAELNRRTVEHWMREGVTVVDPASTWIDCDVSLGQDVTIHPNTQLHGATTVGSGVVLGPDTTLTDVEVAEDASVVRSQCVLAVIGPGASVGPFAYLRPGTEVGARGKVGTFVETKNAVLGEGAKVPHLSYAGDADIGAGTNIGAGTIFANYDGVDKHHTQVGAACRTGANNTFVAPVSIGDGAATGAGAVIRRDVPPGALAVSGGPQRQFDGWVQRRRPGSASARAAANATAPVAESAAEESAPSADPTAPAERGWQREKGEP